MKKRFILTVLAIIFSLSLATTAFAASKEGDLAADYLYCVGLFKGKDVDKHGNPIYDLESSITRQEALVMLIRLLGREQQALSGEWKHPFKDVTPWVDKYVGYAFSTGITQGVAEDEFGGEGESTPAQYITFVLRALGYSDANGDFKWNNPYELSNRIGLTKPGQIPEGTFSRGEAIKISYKSLSNTIKNSRRTLLQTLQNRGVISKQATICLPSDGISIAVGEKVWVWALQSERYDKVELWADWTNGEKATLEWEGKWYNPVCTGFYVTGVTPGTSTITVKYTSGGSEKARDTMTVQVY